MQSSSETRVDVLDYSTPGVKGRAVGVSDSQWYKQLFGDLCREKKFQG
jgi:hypothetical protein